MRGQGWLKRRKAGCDADAGGKESGGGYGVARRIGGGGCAGP